MTTQPSSAQVDAGPTIDLDAEKVRSSIAEGDIIEGNLKCKTGISIAGTVLGDVSCESGAIVVTETGNVVGSLIGKEKIFINGHVGQDGQPAPKITTPGMVVLNTCAVVNADIEYGKLATFGDMTHNGTSRKIASQR